MNDTDPIQPLREARRNRAINCLKQSETFIRQQNWLEAMTWLQNGMAVLLTLEKDDRDMERAVSGPTASELIQQHNLRAVELVLGAMNRS